MKTPYVSIPVTMAALGLVFVACSGTSGDTGKPVTCGPGTTLVEGQCVPAQDGGGQDSGGSADGAVDGGGDAMGDGQAEGGSGDPCPNGPIAINCSNTCGAPKDCDKVKCGRSGPAYALTDCSALPFIIRTPDHPGVDPACPTQCDSSAHVPVYGIALQIALPQPCAGIGIRISVAPPWRISGYSGYDFCAWPPDSLCKYSNVGKYTPIVWTDDPNAPSRNIVIESTSQQCQ